jgi:hypothetical protein
MSSTQEHLRDAEAKMVLKELHIKRRSDLPLVKLLKLIKYILPYGLYKLYQIIKLSLKRH